MKAGLITDVEKIIYTRMDSDVPFPPSEVKDGKAIWSLEYITDYPLDITYKLSKESFVGAISFTTDEDYLKKAEVRIKDKLVGMIMLNIAILPAGRKATIWDLAVSEKYRNQGIATKLIKKVESVLENEEDIKKIWLFSGIKREVAHHLYKKLGYNENDNKAFYKKINQ